MISVTVNSRDGKGDLEIDMHPDYCPICLHNIQPIDTSTRWFYPQESRLENVFMCPRRSCQHMFVTRYSRGLYGGACLLRESVPLTVEKTRNSRTIETLSPAFAAIYGEAEEAELRGLALVCGPGYRKALEFLIKDYIIKLHPSCAEEVKQMFLGKCIADFVTSDRIKQVASRAVWLGNDETHYLRKWEDKDLQDLKNLISLTVHWIEMEELTAETLKDMPTGK